MGKHSNATTETRGTLLTITPTGEFYFIKGLKAYQRNDLRKAKKYLERALQLEPGEPTIASQLAIVCAEIGEYEQSNELLHQIIDEWDTEMVECHYLLANNYAHLGLFEEAYRHASLYIQLETDGEFREDAEDLLHLLLLEDEDGEDDFYFQDDLISMMDESRDMLETGDFHQAIEQLEQIVKEYPNYWPAYNNLSLAYYYTGDLEKAYELVDEILEKNPGNLHALCNKAVFSYYQQDNDSLFHLVEMLKKIKPLGMDHQLKLGTTFSIIGEYEYAYHWLKKLHKNGFEGNSTFYYWLAVAAYYTGKEQLAEKCWNRLVQLEPDKKGKEPWL